MNRFYSINLKYWKWHLMYERIFIYCTLRKEKEGVHSGSHLRRRQKLWILSKMIKLGFGKSQCSSTIMVSLYYNIKGKESPSTFKPNYIPPLSIAALCSMKFCRKCRVKLQKIQGGLWCKGIWINTVWNASGFSYHQNLYFMLYL